MLERLSFQELMESACELVGKLISACCSGDSGGAFVLLLLASTGSNTTVYCTGSSKSVQVAVRVYK
jgi:hypothetical protein